MSPRKALLAFGTMSRPTSSGQEKDLAIDWGDQTPIEADPVTLKDRLLSVCLWGAGSAWLATSMGAITLARSLVDTDRAEWLDRIYISGQIALTGSKWKAVVHPDVREDQQYFFFQNHVNHFDHCSMYNATSHFKQGVELEEHFKYPFYGPFMKKRGTIPVVRGSAEGLKRLIKGIRSEVAHGHSILVFPEGTRTTSGRVQPMKPGVFRIAMDVGIPIVPVAVTGMYDVMRKGSLMIRPGYEVTVFYEKPIPTKGLTHADLPKLMKDVHTAIATRVDDYWRARGKL